MTKSKFGIVRESKDGTIKGYVDMGEKYFCFNEVDVFDSYLDMGYNVVNNCYVMVGGSRTTYLYRYRTEHGDKVEESVDEFTHPTMMMVTELKVN